jgi:signal transduction histidine kinase
VVGRWIETENVLTRRLAFSHELARLFNPRDNLEQALPRLAEALRVHQRADACAIVKQDPRGAPLLYIADRANSSQARGERIEAMLGRTLLAPLAERAVLFRRSPVSSGRIWRALFRGASSAPECADRHLLTELGNLLEAVSFATVPLRSRDQALGRLYLISREARFTRRDLRLLEELAAHAGPLIDNMQLVDRLALEVANEERKRISRDLHDGTIQPYVGLKLGLEALRRRLKPQDDATREVEELVKIAADSIQQLRHYVGDLQHGAPSKPDNALLPAVRHQVRKFTEFYGIETRMLADGDFTGTGRLYNEVVQIVREGLSNIKRHTRARHAAIHLLAGAGRLRVEILNDSTSRQNKPRAFLPRSIAERAKDLGGQVSVEFRRRGLTAVAVELPV